MATDYDAPRRDEVDLGEDSLEELKARRADSQSGAVDVDEVEVAESFELPENAAADAEIGATVAALTADDLEPARRRQLLGRLVDDVRRRGLGQLFRPKAAIRWMADVVGDVAPHIPVRDLDTLHRHFDGM